jgi:hypothetical protein
MLISLFLVSTVATQFTFEGLQFGDPFVGTRQLLGGPPSAYTAPGRLFALKLPANWDAITDKNNRDVVEFVSKQQGEGLLRIARLTVPVGANPRQLLLNSIENKLAKLPGFKLVGKRDVVLAGSKAASALGTYNFQGNIQFQRTVEEIFVVFGTDAFYFHYEGFPPSAGDYVDDLNTFYSSFVPRPPDETGAAQPDVEPLPNIGY